MRDEDYRAIEAVNWSTLKEIRRSPAHYKHALAAPREDTPDMRFGRAVHAAILEPQRYPLDFLVWPGTRRGKAWEEFEASNAGREILTIDEAERVEAIAASVRAHPAAAVILDGASTEYVVRWTDPETGIACKSRLDVCRPSDGAISDLKTCQDASEESFSRSIVSYGYHAQIAFYALGLSALYGEPIHPHRLTLIAIEKRAPYAVAVYQLDAAALAAGMAIARSALRLLAECRAADRWPGYGDEPIPVALPSWALGDLSEAVDMTGAAHG